jgi:hypothetical protein
MCQADRSLAQGERLKEASKINLSLSHLGNVVHRLSENRPGHIPYRDSLLTRLLENALGGSSKTWLLCCASSAPEDLSETVSTLLFASRAKRVSLAPEVNREMSVEELKAALAKANDEIRILKMQLKAAGLLPAESLAEVGLGAHDPARPHDPLSSGAAAKFISSASGAPGAPCAAEGCTHWAEVTELGRQLKDTRDEMAERADEITQLRLERDYYKSQQGDTSKRIAEMFKKWKDEEKVARYWARKCEELKSLSNPSSRARSGSATRSASGGGGGGGGGGGSLASSRSSSAATLASSSNYGSATARSSARGKTGASSSATAAKSNRPPKPSKGNTGNASGKPKKTKKQKKERDTLLEE